MTIIIILLLNQKPFVLNDVYNNKHSLQTNLIQSNPCSSITVLPIVSLYLFYLHFQYK